GGRVPFNKARFMELKGKVKGWPEGLQEAARNCSGLAECREFRRVAGEAEEFTSLKVTFLEEEAEMEID
ncbi:hypothetical protein KEM55_003798, partial [Ascosphaera atra]